LGGQILSTGFTSNLLFLEVVNCLLEHFEVEGVVRVILRDFGLKFDELLDVGIVGGHGSQLPEVHSGDESTFLLHRCRDVIEEGLLELFHLLHLLRLVKAHHRVLVGMKAPLFDLCIFVEIEVHVPDFLLTEGISCLTVLLGVIKSIGLIDFLKLDEDSLFLCEGNLLGPPNTLDDVVFLLGGECNIFKFLVSRGDYES
jgi:hypothetical protein